MSTPAVCGARAPIRPTIALEDHPVVLGEFAALVFSGDRTVLGELPGELTAATMFKFAMEDRSLRCEQDFARSPGMPLPLWPANRVRPIEGVCFVFADDAHPELIELRRMGAAEHEHFVIAETLLSHTADDARRAAVLNVIENIGSDGRILLLGYGDQGWRLAKWLCDDVGFEAQRVDVIEDNADGQKIAESDGHAVRSDADVHRYSAVLYSPLLKYDRLHTFLKRAHGAGMRVFDNSARHTGKERFHARGQVLLDPAADRLFSVKEARVRLRHDELPIESAAVVREDVRVLGNVRIPHLTSGHRAIFHATDPEYDLSGRTSADRLHSQTFAGLRRAFISLRDRPDLSVFAARAHCHDLWPSATARVFPALRPADLGSTRFERILKRHIDGAEIIAASQTSAQQVVLGIVANQYASDAPIIEIGSALGGSAIIMAAATDRERPPIYSIDPETATRHVMRWGFEQHGQLDRLQQVIQTSDEAALQLQHWRGRAGLVFIDGLHTEAAMSADFVNYAPLVKPRGALLIHDVEPPRYSVLRVVIERVLPDPRFRAVCLVDGLLVLERCA